MPDLIVRKLQELAIQRDMFMLLLSIYSFDRLGLLNGSHKIKLKKAVHLD